MPLTDEELYSRYQANVAILSAAMKRRAAEGDAVGAVILARGADVSAVEAVVWEHSTVLARYPKRKFFQMSEQLVTDIGPGVVGETQAETAEAAVEQARFAILTAVDPSLRHTLADSWIDISVLRTLPAPSHDELLGAVRDRTGGMEVKEFIAHRRRESGDAMASALAAEASGQTVEAIEMAYAADLYALEAYLVESAVALGDQHLMSVHVRWELVSEAVAMTGELPQDFIPAVRAIRAAIGGAIGEADAKRLEGNLQPPG